MYENTYMYAIERNGDYLAHYGVRGMKWGVRKAIASGNAKKLSRAYRKAEKHLAKLDKRATRGKNYAKRAALLGAGAAATGALAVQGTKGVSLGIAKGAQTAADTLKNVGGRMAEIKGNGKLAKKARTLGARMYYAGYADKNYVNPMLKKAGEVSGAINRWGDSTNILGKSASIKVGANKWQKNPLYGVTNNTVARVGAGAAAAGLAAGAGYNAYRAATTKRAAKKAAQFRSEMNKAFAGTKYANGGTNRQGKKRRRS